MSLTFKCRDLLTHFFLRERVRCVGADLTHHAELSPKDSEGSIEGKGGLYCTTVFILLHCFSDFFLLGRFPGELLSLP